MLDSFGSDQGESAAVGVDSDVGFVGGLASAFLSGADGCADFAGEVAVVVTSPAVLAGDVAVGVAFPAVAGAASLADLAEVVAVDVISLADVVTPLGDPASSPASHSPSHSLRQVGVSSGKDWPGDGVHRSSPVSMEESELAIMSEFSSDTDPDMED